MSASDYDRSMNIPQEEYDRIAATISSDASPVGIDAKKTHVMLLHMVGQLQSQVQEMSLRLATLEEKLAKNN